MHCPPAGLAQVPPPRKLSSYESRKTIGLCHVLKWTASVGIDFSKIKWLADKLTTRNVDVRLPGKGNSNSHGARPVHLLITMIKRIRTSRLSIKNSLSRSMVDFVSRFRLCRLKRHLLCTVLFKRFGFWFQNKELSRPPWPPLFWSPSNFAVWVLALLL